MHMHTFVPHVIHVPNSSYGIQAPSFHASKMASGQTLFCANQNQRDLVLTNSPVAYAGCVQARAAVPSGHVHNSEYEA